MKLCALCQKKRPRKKFNKNAARKDGLQNVCQDCNREVSRRYYKRRGKQHREVMRVKNDTRRQEIRRKLLEYLTGKSCTDCPENDIVVLEFDHVRGVKRGSVIKLALQGCNWETIMKEIAKCEIRCANCHRRKSAREGKWFRHLGTVTQLVA